MYKNILNNTKFQFVALLTVLIFSVIGVVIFLIYNLRIINDINIYHENLNKITINTVHLKNALDDFKASEHNSDFYELRKDKFSDLVFMKKNELSLINDEMLNFGKADVYEFIPLLKQNQIIFDELEENFSMYLNNQIEIGNNKYGYIQNIEHVEERMEIYLKDKIVLYTYFNSLKNYKTGYLNSLNPEFAESFILESEKFKQSLISSQSITDEKERRLISDAGSEYLNIFKHIYNLHKVQGTDYYSGIYDEIDRLCDEIFININELNNTAKPMIKNDLKNFRIRMLILIFVSVVIIFMTIILLYTIFRKGLYNVNLRSKQMVFAKSETHLVTAEDLFAEISESFDKHENDLKEKEAFVKQITTGNYGTSFEIHEKDALGKALNKLKDTLKNAADKKKEEEAVRIIEDKQKGGIAKFGRILRRHTGDIDTLSYELISELVNYIDADIGGLYITDVNKEEPVLSLRASYAYNERKMIRKDILFGEGLVGTCAVDKTVFYFDEIDEDYIKIVSGFGHAKPESLLICPIFVEEEVYGVLELAAVRKFDKHDIEFIEILAEDIAYTLSYLLSLEIQDDENIEDTEVI